MKTIKKPLTLIFLGLQGSGKGTQAYILREKYGFEILDTGNILRHMIINKIGPLKIIKTIEKGNLVPPMTTNKIIDKAISKVSTKTSLIIDGFPRTPMQIYHLNKILNKTKRIDNYFAIYLKISKKTAIKRVENRWSCSSCGTVYVKNIGRCTSCNGLIAKRKDDSFQYIQKRLHNVSKFLDKVADYYKKRNKLIEINAERPIQEISKDIIARINI
ncbi:hypothetical protein COX95_00685 [bacterium CG_4_10_14_0_2_um_filter_33_32]|nr:MAG: hypothetical protein AUJ93_02280 [bacterium CG2_30_33_46]PIR67378.1 MAG: hypothetical protein COU50_03615 [bacterium CG10_big_fil_rev_8_21_14_0_10_33_18]PIU76766.1 MAG: hypothetical protein COS74_02375 [bacterium CG06_land_8_20_14_3_00_33_50]PIW81289.1 MAG: hypothetical protein COZ97_02510 [bacterium CG_4_8_14_3_um_filter_33_28]PIY85722.1 MAG: hypothetical protein COY76_00730 [bacterium CG_4_10_14_0_8_um_filter_33_57]PIZ86575.1 MAG: hypothetical protein COX95_00685 [bacterium CG_4_10_1